MTQDEIIKLAQEAGFGLMCSKPKSEIVFTAPPIQMLERFADLVAETTLEKAAKVCDEWPNGREDVCTIAAAIRSMK